MSPEDLELLKIQLDERRLEEEIRRADRDADLRQQEPNFQREQFQANTNDWKQIFSPVGVAVFAGLLGLAGTVFTGMQNLTLEREKQFSTRLLERQNQEANLILKLAEQSDDKQRANNLLFFAKGKYLNLPEEYTTYLREVAGLTEGEQIPPPSFAALVDIPPDVNIGLTHAKLDTLIQIFGEPGKLTDNCSEPTNPRLSRLLITADVGPFKVKGLKPAVDAITRVFADVKKQDNVLYQKIGSAGMLCMRKVRGGTIFSNHSWGTAIDITVDGTLANRGTTTTLFGLKQLATYFKKEKFIWGADFLTPDSIHFEASDELLKDWQSAGLLE